MVTCKTVCKINDLQNNSSALHFLGCLSHRERKLITLRWMSQKGRSLAFVDSSFQHLQIIRQLSFAFQVMDFLMLFSVVYVVFYVKKCYVQYVHNMFTAFHNKFQMTSFIWLLLVSKKDNVFRASINFLL